MWLKIEHALRTRIRVARFKIGRAAPGSLVPIWNRLPAPKAVVRANADSARLQRHDFKNVCQTMILTDSNSPGRESPSLSYPEVQSESFDSWFFCNSIADIPELYYGGSRKFLYCPARSKNIQSQCGSEGRRWDTGKHRKMVGDLQTGELPEYESINISICSKPTFAKWRETQELYMSTAHIESTKSRWLTLRLLKRSYAEMRYQWIVGLSECSQMIWSTLPEPGSRKSWQI